MTRALKVLTDDLRQWKDAEQHCISTNNLEDANFILKNNIQDLESSINLIKRNYQSNI